MDMPSLVLFLTVCRLVTTTDNTVVSANLNIDNDMSIYRERGKRSVLWTLFREIRNGAKFVEKIKTPYDEPLLRYTKLGGRKQALLDLQATKPTFVEKQPTGEITAQLADSYHVSIRTNRNGETVLIVFGEHGAVRSGAKFFEKIKTPYDEPLLRYTKLGGRKQALLDFQAIKPTFVEKQPTGDITAQIADPYHVSLRTNRNGETVLIVFGKHGAVRSVRYIERPGDNVYQLFQKP